MRTSRGTAAGRSTSVTPCRTGSGDRPCSPISAAFASNSLPVCTVSGTSVTLLTAGICSITARQAGDADWNPASPIVARTFNVIQATSTMTLTASAVSANPIPQFSDPLLLTAVLPAGASGTVNFSLGTSPTAAAATWASSPVQVTADGTATATIPALDSLVAPNGAASYVASASFVASGGSAYSSTSTTTSVVLGKEGQGAGGNANGSSRVEFAGTQFVVGTAPKLTATLLQSLAPEATDRVFVDFSKVTVNATFQLYPAGCDPTCATAPAWPVSPSTAGTARVSNVTGATDGRGTVSLANVPKTLAEGSYLVVVTIDSNAYLQPLRATSTLTVATTNGTYMLFAGNLTVKPK